MVTPWQLSFPRTPSTGVPRKGVEGIRGSGGVRAPDSRLVSERAWARFGRLQTHKGFRMLQRGPGEENLDWTNLKKEKGKCIKFTMLGSVGGY